MGGVLQGDEGGGESSAGPGEASETDERLRSLAFAAGGIAHDLNNLLAVTLTHCEALARDRGLSADGRASLDVVHQSMRRATELVGRLLALGRPRPPVTTPVDVNGVVTDVSNLLARVLGADVCIELELTRGLPPVQTDATELEQSVMNLMLNARSAMRDGGTIRVVTGQREQARGFDGAQIAASCVVVAISDTGAGMTAEVRARIFEPFFSTRPPGAGTGLGLSSVHRWLRSCGGVIDVQSQPGHGTTFTLALRC
jgi:signal transduction histidine kinase